MKRRHAHVLDDFEASSVILFAALVAGGGLLPPSHRAANLPSVSSSGAPSRTLTKETDQTGADGSRQAAARERSRVGNAVTIAIEQFGGSQTRGFVPFGPVH